MMLTQVPQAPCRSQNKEIPTSCWSWWTGSQNGPRSSRCKGQPPRHYERADIGQVRGAQCDDNRQRSAVNNQRVQEVLGGAGDAPPNTPQETPMERAKGTVKTMIAQFTGVEQRTWDENWPELQLAVNTSMAEGTGYSTAFITQGIEPNLPNELPNRPFSVYTARYHPPCHLR